VHTPVDSRPRDEKGRFVKKVTTVTEDYLPIDTTTVNDVQEEELQFILNQSYILSNRLNQLRCKIRQTDRDKLEIEAISKQIAKLNQEFEELKQSKKK
jgi:hypothetical protein